MLDMNSSGSRKQLPYKTASFILTNSSKSFKFEQPADPDEVLSMISDQTSCNDRSTPYWAENWPSASPFFSFIMEQDFPEGMEACEIGCGLGVLSCALAYKQVFTIATDISIDSCHFALRNISGNCGSPRVICADWQRLPLKRRFDLIVASDVLYEERWISVILNCLGSTLAPGGKAWIADPCRRYWSIFKEQAANSGFSVRTIHSQVLYDSRISIEIIELKSS